MITVKENTTLVGVSELRTNIDNILSKLKDHKVVIGKRNKPIAVLIDMEKYDEMEKVLELLEDTALGLLAKEREAKSSAGDYIDIETIEKKISKK